MQIQEVIHLAFLPCEQKNSAAWMKPYSCLTCANVRCSAEFPKCEMQPNPGSAQCPRKPVCVKAKVAAYPTCDTTDCDPGYKCIMREVQCIQAPCPPIPVCIQERPTCDKTVCCQGEKCVLEEVVCVQAPCYPVPKCIPANCTGCALIFCAGDTECVLEPGACEKAPCCSEPRCKPIGFTEPKTCENIKCPLNQCCQMGPGKCSDFPCPDPQPQCVACSTCANVKCGDGKICEEEKNPSYPDSTCCATRPVCNPPVCLTCANVLCAPGSLRCEMQPSAGPDSQWCPEKPVCVQPEPAYPNCSTTVCQPGETCTMEDVQCIQAPCPPVPVCIPVNPLPACDEVVCPRGQQCVMQQVQCIRAPCNPVPTCIPESCPTCAATLCLTNSTCGMEPVLSDGVAGQCCLSGPVCRPIESPPP